MVISLQIINNKLVTTHWVSSLAAFQRKWIHFFYSGCECVCVWPIGFFCLMFHMHLHHHHCFGLLLSHPAICSYNISKSMHVTSYCYSFLLPWTKLAWCELLANRVYAVHHHFLVRNPATLFITLNFSNARRSSIRITIHMNNTWQTIHAEPCKWWSTGMQSAAFECYHRVFVFVMVMDESSRYSRWLY